MHSEHDGAVPLDHAYYAYNNIPTAELCILDNWGHLIWLGKEAIEVNRKTVNFLQRGVTDSQW
jgi:esterase/lipase